jgi:hypothetical protein
VSYYNLPTARSESGDSSEAIPSRFWPTFGSPRSQHSRRHSAVPPQADFDIGDEPVLSLLLVMVARGLDEKPDSFRSISDVLVGHTAGFVIKKRQERRFLSSDVRWNVHLVCICSPAGIP